MLEFYTIMDTLNYNIHYKTIDIALFIYKDVCVLCTNSTKQNISQQKQFEELFNTFRATVSWK